MPKLTNGGDISSYHSYVSARERAELKRIVIIVLCIAAVVLGLIVWALASW